MYACVRSFILIQAAFSYRSMSRRLGEAVRGYDHDDGVARSSRLFLSFAPRWFETYRTVPFR